MIGDAIAQAIIGAMVAVAIGTALLVIFFIFGVPAIWGWIKPFLHVLTA